MEIKLQQIYDNSPIFFQNLMVSVEGIRKYRIRYGKLYFEYKRFLKEFEKLSFEEKENYQLNELKKLINYAVKKSSFYKKLYEKIDLEKIKSFDDMKILPIVDKETLRQNINEIVTMNKKYLVVGHTGGTTGKSLEVYFTKEDIMKRMALLDYFKAKHGFENRIMKRATFNGKHIIPPNQKSKIFWRYNMACKQMIYSSFNLTEENIPFYINSLNEFQPDAIDGFFSCIYDIANYLLRKNIELKFQPIAIFPTSETVTQEGREKIEQAFSCKLYDQYASSEGAPFITECKEGKLHIEMVSGIFERLNDSTDEVIVTSFTTYGTPLIRYRIGDSIKFSNERYKCKCGVESPIVESIEGREKDFLYTVEGARVNAGNVANIFKNIPNAIIRSQIIQKNLDKILIKMQVDNNFYKEEFNKIIIEEVKHKFGINMNVDIEIVEKIEKEKSGKYKFIINEVKI